MRSVSEIRRDRHGRAGGARGGPAAAGADGHLPADLLGAGRSAAPTFAEYIPIVREAVGEGSRKAYNTYWNRVLEHWSQRRIDEVRPSDIERLAEHVKANRVQRRNARGGHGSAENLITALRCLYRRAVADCLLSEGENPALKVSKPRRLPSTRRAVPDNRLAEINEVAVRTSDDPDLDSLLLRLHTETACRRGGALALRPMDLDATQCLIRLQEKGDAVRWQPVSPTLMRHLLLHAEQRQSPSEGQRDFPPLLTVGASAGHRC
jgi:integrase/recombinase XerC